MKREVKDSGAYVAKLQPVLMLAHDGVLNLSVFWVEMEKSVPLQLWYRGCLAGFVLGVDSWCGAEGVGGESVLDACCWHNRLHFTDRANYIAWPDWNTLTDKTGILSSLSPLKMIALRSNSYKRHCVRSRATFIFFFSFFLKPWKLMINYIIPHSLFNISQPFFNNPFPWCYKLTNSSPLTFYVRGSKESLTKPFGIQTFV